MRKKKLSLILFSVILTGLAGYYYFINLHQLLSKSYYVDESKFYRIDTFHLLNRAYEESDHPGRHSRLVLTFESIDRYSFIIDGDFFPAVTDRKKLEDTLMYHDLKFIVFSDEATYDKYKESKRPIFIKVYQIKIGDTKYIDFEKLNSSIRGDKIMWVILPPVILVILVIVAILLLKKIKRSRKV